MSGEYNYPDIFDGEGREEGQTGGGLRKQLEEALAANKKLSERLDKLERKAPAEELLKGKGINPQAVDLIPDGMDPKDWVEKYGHLFGGAQPNDEDPEPEVEVHDPALDEERQALESVQQHEASTGIPSTASADQIEKLKSFESEADLLAYIQSGGAT